MKKVAHWIIHFTWFLYTGSGPSIALKNLERKWQNIQNNPESDFIATLLSLHFGKLISYSCSCFATLTFCCIKAPLKSVGFFFLLWHS